MNEDFSNYSREELIELIMRLLDEKVVWDE